MTPDFSRYFWSGRSVFEASVPLDEVAGRSLHSSVQVDLSVLFERCSTDSPAGQVVLPGNITVFMPENYEPNYAYPLIVWLSGRESGMVELLDFMPEISSRNCFGVSVSEGERSSLEDDIYEIVYSVRREYHIHSERVLLAAFGNKAVSGLELLLRRPDWFGGLISFNGCFTNSQFPFVRFDDLRGKRVLFGMHARVRNNSMPETIRIARLLHSAGMEIATRVYDADDEVTPRMLSDINHWVMDGICESNLV